MKNYKNYFLNKLIDSYEGSKNYTNSENKQNIYFRFNEKNIKEYYSETNYEYKENIDASCRQLCNEGFISVIKGKGLKSHLIEKIKLNVDNIEKAYKYLGRKPKCNKENDLINILKVYKNENHCLNNFIDFVTSKLNENKSIKKYLDIDNICECKDIILGVSEALKLEEETFKRNFSIKVYGDSKRYEHIENKVLKIIKDFGNEDNLNDYNIISNYTYVYFKGDISFHINNSIINGNDFIGGIAISSKDIDKIENIKVNGGKLFTIENLTTFNNFSEKAVVIYLGGYHNKVRRDLLRKIAESNSEITYYHFGDIDAGGFKILNHLRKKTGINFKAYNMNSEVLEKYINYGKNLTCNDKIEIERLINNNDYTEFKDVLEKMLKLNKKLEQEIIL